MPKFKTRLILTILFLLPVYLVKIKFGWASFNVLELLIAILFVFYFFDKNTKYKIQNTRYKTPVFLIFIGLVLSVIANGNYYTGLGAIKGWFIAPIIFAIIFYDALKKDEDLLKKSLLALFFSGVAISAVGVVYKFLGVVTFDDRLKIFWDSPNQLSMFLAIPFLIGIEKFGFEELRASASKGKTELWRDIAINIGVLLIALNLYFTGSFGAWLALAIAIIVMFWLKYKKFAQKKYFVFVGLILIIVLFLVSVNKYKDIKSLGKQSSLASREMIWKSATLMIEKNPLFGIGPGNFQEKYLEYQKYFPPYLEWSAPQPHNIFLAFWLESGLVGLAGFVLLLFYFFRDNKKVYPFTKINKHNNAQISEIKKQTSDKLTDKENFSGGAIKATPHTKTDRLTTSKNFPVEIKKQTQDYSEGFGDGASRDLGILFLAIMIYILVHGLVDTTYWRNDLALFFWMVVAMNMYFGVRKN